MPKYNLRAARIRISGDFIIARGRRALDSVPHLATKNVAVLSLSGEGRKDKEIAPRRSFTPAAYVQDDNKKLLFPSS